MSISKGLYLPLSLLDKALLLIMLAYDKYMYTPMQTHLTPLIAKIPREVSIGGVRVTVLTANRVTYARTSLLVVIAFGLKYSFNGLACACVILNDLLDHLDGIVAKAQKKVYGNIDSPLLGAFVDAFCDKVVNVSLLWSILLLVDLCTFSLGQFLVFVGVASAIICLECVLGIVRVQDYYKAKYTGPDATPSPGMRASMEGKTKEKLENIGLSLICLAMAYSNPMDSWFGWFGIGSLGLSLRFAVSSLLYKLKSRQEAKMVGNGHVKPSPTVTQISDDVFEGNNYVTNCDHHSHNGRIPRQHSAPIFRLSHSSSDSDDPLDDSANDHTPNPSEGRVDKIYTVGCFDLFHRGHQKLLKNMRKLGKEVIVGIHNDESYYKLKRKHPIDVVEKRMGNVKKFADQVFVISSTDPSPYLSCCIHLKPTQTALYVRGDDMPQFPGRGVIEPLMPIQLLPYTQGVSSTKLRAELLMSLKEKEQIQDTENDKLKSL